MENEQRKCVVEYRPAAPGMYLSEMAKYHLSSMVPYGRITRDKDIRNALAKLFGVSRVSFEREYAQMMRRGELTIICFMKQNKVLLTSLKMKNESIFF